MKIMKPHEYLNWMNKVFDKLIKNEKINEYESELINNFKLQDYLNAVQETIPIDIENKRDTPNYILRLYKVIQYLPYETMQELIKMNYGLYGLNKNAFLKEEDKETFSDRIANWYKTIFDNSSTLPIQENKKKDDNNTMENHELQKPKITVGEYITLAKDINEIKIGISWMKWVIPLLVTIGIFVSGNIVNSIKETNASNMQSIEKSIISLNQRLDDQYKYIDAKTQKK